MNTEVALMFVLHVEKVLHQTESVQGCLHQILSVRPHLLPEIKTMNSTQLLYIIMIIVMDPSW